MIYLVYPLMAILLLWGCKPYGRGTWNEEAFSLRQMKALQGFFAICIMLHHIGQKTCASWLDSYLIIPGLEFFVPRGYLYVSVFFFCSGYGLYKSLQAKPNYLQGFAAKRILPIVLSFYVTGWIFLLARFLMKEKLTAPKVFYYASGLQLSNPNSWFVIALPFFYLAFYLAFRHCKKESAAITCILLFTLAYQLLGTLVDHNDWWMRGEWWYNSVHLFVIGLLFAKKEEEILRHVRKHYWVYFAAFLLGTILFFVLSEIALAFVSYYGEYWNAPDTLPRRWICLISQLLSSYSFVFFIFLLSMKLRIGNRFLAFMGSITLEFYLIHGLFLELFSYDFAGVAPSITRITNVPLLILVVFVPSIPAALLLKKLDAIILSPLGKKSKQ